VKENYLYFHISSWKSSGKSAEVFGRYSCPPHCFSCPLSCFSCPLSCFSQSSTHCISVLTFERRAIEQALLDMQDVCQPKKKMARKNSEQALDLLAH
jgi:hypothetical protein